MKYSKKGLYVKMLRTGQIIVREQGQSFCGVAVWRHIGAGQPGEQVYRSLCVDQTRRQGIAREVVA